MKLVRSTLFFTLLFIILFALVSRASSASSDLKDKLYLIQQNSSASHDDKVSAYQQLLLENDDDFSTTMYIYDALLLEHLDLGNYYQVKALFSELDFSKLTGVNEADNNVFVKLNTHVINALLMLQEYEHAQTLILRILPFSEMPYISNLNKGNMFLAAGQYYVRSSSFKKGLKAFSQAEKAFTKSAQLAVTQTREGEKSQLELEATSKLTTTVFYVGNTYFTMGDYEKAVEYYSRGLAQLGARAELEDLVVYNHNIALCLLYLEQWELSIQNAALASDFAKDINSDVFYAFTQEIIARARHGLGQTVEAISILQTQVIPTLEENNLTQRLLEALSFTARFYISREAWADAQLFLSKANDLVTTAQADMLELIPTLTYFEANYLMYEYQNNYKKAFDYHKSYAQMNAQDFALKQEQEAQRLMMDYELGLAQEKALRLEADNKIKSVMIESNKNKSNFLQLIISLASLSFIVMVYLYTKERKTRDMMSKLAMTDPLTSCPNRRSIMHNAYKILESYSKSNNKPVINKWDKRKAIGNQATSMAVAIVDVDNFKLINDNYGHNIGDEVLKNIAQLLVNNLRENDVMGRYGGEEFILILPNANEQDLQTVFKRMQKALKHHACEINGDKVNLPVTISMGANVFQPERQSQSKEQLNSRLSQLISVADKQVYKAKALGRNQLAYSTVTDNS